MSRHSLQPLGGPSAVYEIAIGWDRGLATYFVIIFGVPDDRENGHHCGTDDELVPLLWEGTRRAELVSPEAAIEIAAHYATIPNELAAQLANDREIESASVADTVRNAFLARFWPNMKGKP
ncbi:MAG: hypothetical protein ABL931_00340 [Usitatibacteraceae bacterium]